MSVTRGELLSLEKIRWISAARASPSKRVLPALSKGFQYAQRCLDREMVGKDATAARHPGVCMDGDEGVHAILGLEFDAPTASGVSPTADASN